MLYYYYFFTFLLTYIASPPLPYVPGPYHHDDVDDPGDNDGHVDREVVLEAGLGKDVLKVEAGGLDKEAAAKERHVRRLAGGHLVRDVDHLRVWLDNFNSLLTWGRLLNDDNNLQSWARTQFRTQLSTCMLKFTI